MKLVRCLEYKLHTDWSIEFRQRHLNCVCVCVFFYRFRRFAPTVFATNSPGDGQSCVRKSVLKRRREAKQVVDVLCEKEVYGEIVVGSGPIETKLASFCPHDGMDKISLL